MAFETSCDETSVAVLKNDTELLSNVIASQIESHKRFGGVVPEVASRHHVEVITACIEEALEEAGITEEEVTAVAVTYGPGLVGALLVGVAAAKALSFAASIPLIGVHHLEGHMFAPLLTHPELTPPFVGLIVMLSVPFALVGGIWLMWVLGYHMSVAVAVGFIALAGVAAETGVVMLIYLDHAWEEVKRSCHLAGRDPTATDLYTAIMEGAVERVRPKMMTVVAIMAGLLPILWSTGTGSEVMSRIAAPMVGGMISSTILTLAVIPAIYALVKSRKHQEIQRVP